MEGRECSIHTQCSISSPIYHLCDLKNTFLQALINAYHYFKLGARQAHKKQLQKRISSCQWCCSMLDDCRTILLEWIHWWSCTTITASKVLNNWSFTVKLIWRYLFERCGYVYCISLFEIYSICMSTDSCVKIYYVMDFNTMTLFLGNTVHNKPASWSMFRKGPLYWFVYFTKCDVNYKSLMRCLQTFIVLVHHRQADMYSVDQGSLVFFHISNAEVWQRNAIGRLPGGACQCLSNTRMSYHLWHEGMK